MLSDVFLQVDRVYDLAFMRWWKMYIFSFFSSPMYAYMYGRMYGKCARVCLLTILGRVRKHVTFVVEFTNVNFGAGKSFCMLRLKAVIVVNR